MQHTPFSPAPLEPGDELITSTEARRLAGGVSDMAIWRWLKRGIIPEPLVIERRRYWIRREFLAALTLAGTKGVAVPECAMSHRRPGRRQARQLPHELAEMEREACGGAA